MIAFLFPSAFDIVACHGHRLGMPAMNFSCRVWIFFLVSRRNSRRLVWLQPRGIHKNPWIPLPISYHHNSWGPPSISGKFRSSIQVLKFPQAESNDYAILCPFWTGRLPWCRRWCFRNNRGCKLLIPLNLLVAPRAIDKSMLRFALTPTNLTRYGRWTPSTYTDEFWWHEIHGFCRWSFLPTPKVRTAEETCEGEGRPFNSFNCFRDSSVAPATSMC